MNRIDEAWKLTTDAADRAIDADEASHEHSRNGRVLRAAGQALLSGLWSAASVMAHAWYERELRDEAARRERDTFGRTPHVHYRGIDDDRR